jgi:hypothetical protein
VLLGARILRLLSAHQWLTVELALSSRFKLYCAGRYVALQRFCRVPPLLSTGLSTSKCGLQNDLQLPAVRSGSFLDASIRRATLPYQEPLSLRAGLWCEAI